MKDWRLRNPDKQRVASQRSSHRQRLARVNLTDREYHEMLSRQNDACAVCKQSFFDGTDKVRINIDHDHATGRVRGLLCSPCNKGLGFFLDNPERLDAAASYLRGD